MSTPNKPGTITAKTGFMENPEEPFSIKKFLQNFFKEVNELLPNNDSGNMRFFVNCVENIINNSHKGDIIAAMQWFKPREAEFKKYADRLEEVESHFQQLPDGPAKIAFEKHTQTTFQLRTAYAKGGITGYNAFLKDARNQKNINDLQNEMQKIMDKKTLFSRKWTLSPLNVSVFQKDPPPLLLAIYQLMGESGRLKNYHVRPALRLAKGKAIGDQVFADVLRQYLKALVQNINNLEIPYAVSIVYRDLKETIQTTVEAYLTEVAEQASSVAKLTTTSADKTQTSSLESQKIEQPSSSLESQKKEQSPIPAPTPASVPVPATASTPAQTVETPQAQPIVQTPEVQPTVEIPQVQPRVETPQVQPTVQTSQVQPTAQPKKKEPPPVPPPLRPGMLRPTVQTASPTIAETEIVPPKASPKVTPHPIENFVHALKTIRRPTPSKPNEYTIESPIQRGYSKALPTGIFDLASNFFKEENRQGDIEFLQTVVDFIAQQQNHRLDKQDASIILGAIILLENALNLRKDEFFEGITEFLSYLQKIKNEHKAAFYGLSPKTAVDLLEEFILDARSIEAFTELNQELKPPLDYLQQILNKAPKSTSATPSPYVPFKDAQTKSKDQSPKPAAPKPDRDNDTWRPK